MTDTSDARPQPFDALVAQLVETWLAHREPDGSRVHYPGWPSNHGRSVDGLEGFSRMAPLLAAWLSSGRPPLAVAGQREPVDFAQLLRDGFNHGTDPARASYWGGMRDYDQRIIEAADLALALWLSRATVWDQLDQGAQRQIANWLRQVQRGRVHDNNWHLSVVLVVLVLEALGCGTSEAGERHYTRFRSFHAGDGWFRDGPQGPFDYYNAWAIHYTLHWIGEIAPTWDRVFLDEVARAFLPTLLHLIGPQGLPIMGRSVCYRLAVAAPLIQGHMRHPAVVSAGQARRALEVTYRHFLAHGAVREGRVTQGY